MVGDILAAEHDRRDTLAVERGRGDPMAMVGTQEDTMAVVGTQEDTMAVVGTQAVITPVPVRVIIPVGTAGGGIGIIPVVIGGALGTMLILVGGGLIRTPIHISITILIRMAIHIPITILIPIPIPILMICLRRRPPKSPPHMASSRNNLTTGTTARIRRATIHMLKAVREAGDRWNQIRPRPNRKGGHGKCTGNGLFYCSLLL